MNRNEFMNELRQQIHGIPDLEMERSFNFYEEIIDDFIEEGKTEEEAVACLESMDEIVSGIKESVPMQSIIKDRMDTVSENKGKRGKYFKYALIPFWIFVLPILIVTYYAVIWIMYACYALAAVFLMLISVLSPFYSVMLLWGNKYAALFLIGISFILIGCFPYLMYGLKKYFITTKKLSLGFIKKLKKYLLR